MQIVQILIRRRLMRRLTWVCSVCLCPINGTLGFIGLKKKLIFTEKGVKNAEVASPESVAILSQIVVCPVCMNSSSANTMS